MSRLERVIRRVLLGREMERESDRNRDAAHRLDMALKEVLQK
ncbi:hypothetical protein [Vannielia sp.]|nr:hypothetical protein [Vannielia sp.]MDF1871533.1 hypothetical protein [Vannielia sp.]